jgi:hypothetical protein
VQENQSTGKKLQLYLQIKFSVMAAHLEKKSIQNKFAERY